MNPVSRMEEFDDCSFFYDHNGRVLYIWCGKDGNNKANEFALNHAVFSTESAPVVLGANKVGKIVGFIEPKYGVPNPKVLLVRFEGFDDAFKMTPAEVRNSGIDFQEASKERSGDRRSSPSGEGPPRSQGRRAYDTH